jgi:hypothetical protein
MVVVTVEPGITCKSQMTRLIIISEIVILG